METFGNKLQIKGYLEHTEIAGDIQKLLSKFRGRFDEEEIFLLNEVSENQRAIAEEIKQDLQCQSF